MDNTTFKIAAAGLLHDIGKFADNKIFKLSSYEIDSIRPNILSGKQHSYTHAVYTSEFISRYSEYLPENFNISDWGEGNESLGIISASHHSPSSPLQEIITQADWISSGMDRKNSDDMDSSEVRDYKKVRMVPVLESLNYKNNNSDYSKKNFKYALPLTPISAQNIFPIKNEDIQPSDMKKAENEYMELFNEFETEFKNLKHIDLPELWFQHFESLLAKYTSMIPSARAGKIVPDISLYDHLKTTSGIAASIYLYHKDQNSLERNAIKKQDIQKFILISADFHGIQEFIFSGYGDVRKYRSKLFRGRSFYVSLISELAADLFCKEAGLPHTSVLLSAGGKFTIIAPNTQKTTKALDKTEKIVNKWFADKTYSQSGISFSYVLASSKDFTNNKFADLYDHINKSLLEKKLHKFDIENLSGVVEDYFEGQDLKLCPFCGKRPGTSKYKENNICGICKDQIYIGENLVKSEKNIIEIFINNSSEKSGELKENIFNLYNIIFSKGKTKHKNQPVKFFKTDEKIKSDFSCSVKNISGYVPAYNELDILDTVVSQKDEEIEIKKGDVKLFEDIAASNLRTDEDGKKTGLDALGVLKADVDDLGLLMGCGLNKNVYSISRTASLSRQLNNFFAVFLPSYLESNYSNIYTVFAGGDDLFLIGPWSDIINFSIDLRQKFDQYTGFNKNISFSAGIYLCKSNTPVDTIADMAEKELEKSKDQPQKNSLTVFGQTENWTKFNDLREIFIDLKHLLEFNIISTSMLYKLNKFCELSEVENEVITAKKPDLSNIEALKWKSLLLYSLSRNLRPEGEKEDKDIQIKNITKKIIYWIETYRGSFRIPLWKLLYSIRTK